MNLVKAAYVEQNTPHDVRISKLTVAMFAPAAGQFPEVRLKAVKMRYFVAALRSVDWRLCTGTDKSKSRYLVLDSLTKIHTICDSPAWRLDKPTLARFRKAMITFQTSVGFLQDKAIQEGVLLWKATFKNHVAWHCLADAKYLCPRLWACYGFEDFVGIIGNLSKHRGGETIFQNKNHDYSNMNSKHELNIIC
jgi:hypothetical protein